MTDEIMRVSANLILAFSGDYSPADQKREVEHFLTQGDFKYRMERSGDGDKYVIRNGDAGKRWPTVHVLNARQQKEEWTAGLEPDTSAFQMLSVGERVAIFSGATPKPGDSAAEEVWHFAKRYAKMLEDPYAPGELILDNGRALRSLSAFRNGDEFLEWSGHFSD